MYALHLPSRHLWIAGLIAVALALAFVLAADWLATADLNLFSGGSAAASDPVPPATWATDPLAPPTILLTR
jgi:hypothetical protein